MIETLQMYFQYPFVRYAMIVGVLVALCSSLLGVTLVLKRFSFIGDGLSHVAFLAMAVAAIFQWTNNMPLILAVTILAAIVVLCMGETTLLKGDAAIAMISVTSLALGYLFMNMFSSSSNISGDVCTTLFGSTSILTLSTQQVILSSILSIIVVIIYILFYNKIFALTFDEDFSRAIGVNVSFYNFAIAVIIAVIIVLAMNLVGSLLTSALIIFPALSTMRLYKSFKAVVISSAVLSVLCAGIGIIVSILAGTPVGSTIVGIEIIAYAMCVIVGKVVVKI
ncbi:MAG: metal ABC transporter permease [Lachnospiraceae bacterium]|nr:metal ABC transporter permease [Lachnospiraceae bacterium]